MSKNVVALIIYSYNTPMKNFILNNQIAIILWLSFVGTVYAANWSITEFGYPSIGFGLSAPAGVYFAGIAFTLRDLLHVKGNRFWIISAIIVGALLSGILESDAQRIALGSGLAFLLSETADWLVYSPISKKNWLAAVLASNTVGLVLDSIIFLSVAFGSLQYIEGQIVGKAYMTLIAIAILAIARFYIRKSTKTA